MKTPVQLLSTDFLRPVPAPSCLPEFKVQLQHRMTYGSKWEEWFSLSCFILEAHLNCEVGGSHLLFWIHPFFVLMQSHTGREECSRMHFQ